MSFSNYGRSLANIASIAGLAIVISLVNGCGPAAEPTTDTPTDGSVTTAEIDPHAGHSHAGKRGGHVVVLDPGHVHAEYVHVDADDILEVYIDDKPELVTAVEVVVETAGQDAKTYVLESAESALGTGGYQLKDPLLLTGIQMADGASNKATLKVTTADGEMTADLVDDHDH